MKIQSLETLYTKCQRLIGDCRVAQGGIDRRVRHGIAVGLSAARPAHYGHAANAALFDAAAGLLAAQHVRTQQAVVVPDENAPPLHARAARRPLLFVELLSSRKPPAHSATIPLPGPFLFLSLFQNKHYTRFIGVI